VRRFTSSFSSCSRAAAIAGLHLLVPGRSAARGSSRRWLRRRREAARQRGQSDSTFRRHHQDVAWFEAGASVAISLQRLSRTILHLAQPARAGMELQDLISWLPLQGLCGSVFNHFAPEFASADRWTGAGLLARCRRRQKNRSALRWSGPAGFAGSLKELFGTRRRRPAEAGLRQGLSPSRARRAPPGDASLSSGRRFRSVA